MALGLFADRLPAWCHRDGPLAGLPLSWGHYLYGMAHINRARARGKVDTHDAVRVAGATNERSRKEWVADMNDLAEWDLPPQPPPDQRP